MTKVLKQAMTKLRNELGEERFNEVWTYELNPKSDTMSQLCGGFDDATGEWRDGLIGELFRIAASDKQPIKKWIIFDGPRRHPVDRVDEHRARREQEAVLHLG